MTRKPLVLAGLCVALLAAPAFAQQGNPGGAMPPSTSTMSGPQSGPTNPSKPTTGMTRHRTRHVARATRPLSCWDLAWESQAMKTCFARHPAQASQHPQAAQMLNQSGGTSGGRY